MQLKTDLLVPFGMSNVEENYGFIDGGDIYLTLDIILFIEC